MKRSDKITKHISKLQDKLEGDKLSPKQVKQLRKSLEAWMGVVEVMALDIDKTYPPLVPKDVIGNPSAILPALNKTTPGQHG